MISRISCDKSSSEFPVLTAGDISAFVTQFVNVFIFGFGSLTCGGTRVFFSFEGKCKIPVEDAKGQFAHQPAGKQIYGWYQIYSWCTMHVSWLSCQPHFGSHFTNATPSAAPRFAIVRWPVGGQEHSFQPSRQLRFITAIIYIPRLPYAKKCHTDQHVETLLNYGGI